MNYDVKDLNLADEGKRKAEWAAKEMPVLGEIKKRFEKETQKINFSQLKIILDSFFYSSVNSFFISLANNASNFLITFVNHNSCPEIYI